MRRKNTFFAVASALLPLAVNELLSKTLSAAHPYARIAISFIISFLILWGLQFLLNKANRLNKYCGQWVEEMIQYDAKGNPAANFVGIGIIRHDHTTDEHTFVGRTYTLTGDEKYSWSIDYLRANKDTSLQYVCLVQNPIERSIGQITFHSRDECEGLIWCMNGISYTYKAYRITKKMLIDLELSKCAEKYAGIPLYKGMVISQRNCPDFVRRYGTSRFRNKIGSAP